MTDREALDAIVAIMDKPEWSGADDMQAISNVLDQWSEDGWRNPSPALVCRYLYADGRRCGKGLGYSETWEGFVTEDGRMKENMVVERTFYCSGGHIAALRFKDDEDVLEWLEVDI